METEYIIAGGGSAGCSLALELVSRGKRVLLFSDGKPGASSVAAGLVNPIVPKRVIPAWNAQMIFPNISEFYRRIGDITGTYAYTEMPMFQIFATKEEAKLWQRQCNKVENMDFIFPAGVPVNYIHAPFGAAEIKFCGRLDVQMFCKSTIEFLKSKGMFRSEKIKHKSLLFSDNHIIYKDIYAKGVVFCEGTGLENNPWFQSVPMLNTWGDILRIKCQNLNGRNIILKQKHWLIPDTDNTFLCGSNFRMSEGSAEEISKGIREIVEGLKTWLPEFVVVEKLSGCRPTISDRRPVMGESVKQAGCYVYNGLGTRGCSLVTWLTPVMADFLLGKKDLPREVNVHRFSNL